MNSKQRVITALNRNIPDRLPLDARFVPKVRKALHEKTGINDYYEMCVTLGLDVLCTGAIGIGKSFYGPSDEYVDEWGCTWKYFKNTSGEYTEIITHPLEDDETGELLASFIFPDANIESRYADTKKLVQRYGETHYIAGMLNCSIFEPAHYMRGMENFLVDLMVNPEYAEMLLDKTTYFSLVAGLKLIDCGVDMVFLGDDVGTQNGMLISPDLWKKYLKPRLAKLISSYKERNPKIKVAYHSCGYIIPIIEDLIEIGLDVLHPIQPTAMDPADVKKHFGDRLCFDGSICIQKTLPSGTFDEIRAEVLLRKQTIGEGGGLIIGPAHTIQSDTSVDNILCLFDAVRDQGRY